MPNTLTGPTDPFRIASPQPTPLAELNKALADVGAGISPMEYAAMAAERRRIERQRPEEGRPLLPWDTFTGVNQRYL